MLNCFIFLIGYVGGLRCGRLKVYFLARKISALRYVNQFRVFNGKAHLDIYGNSQSFMDFAQMQNYQSLIFLEALMGTLT